MTKERPICVLAPLQALCQAIPAVQFQCPGRHLDRNSQSVPGQGATERLPFQACKTRTIREQIPDPGTIYRQRGGGDTRDDFYRYGWAMSNTEVVAFGSKVERRIKQMLFLYLDTHVSIGIPLSTAIRNFQNSFGFDDDTWSYETIRREYNRHGYRKTVENTTILDFINRIILGKLSEFGTISQQGKMTYESNAL